MGGAMIESTYVRGSLAALLCAGILTAATVSEAAPVTTVPWNGYTGAVSFTYDDARPDQLPRLVPQLDSLGIKATFYIAVTGAGGNFETRSADYIQLARQGHEITNHTYRHTNLQNATDALVDSAVSNMANYLRGLDTVIQSVTFAYPNCNAPPTTGKTRISAQNFIARGCANTSYVWGSQPTDWMNIQALILTSSPNNVNTAVTLLNTAKNQNRWASLIIHDVTPSPDQYSLTPANNLQLLTTAIANGSWIDTYQNIAAYYRAHFTIDTAQAVQVGNLKRVQWVSPHAKMPRRVPLRVRLDAAVFGDSAVVVQDSVVVTMNPDSTYVVDFMKLRMDVYPKGTVAVLPATRFRLATLHAEVSGKTLRLHGLLPGTYAVEIRDIRGGLLERGE
jgi:peptidoglycan/xylan/chitin deacetylase (PgdA/CDA1 family)